MSKLKTVFYELDEIGTALQHELLPQEETRRLIAVLQSAPGSPEAEEAEASLVEHNMRLVVMVARRFRFASDQDFADLVCLGKIGIIRAARRFDLSSGNVFSTYAVQWVRSEITRNGTHKGQRMYFSSALYDERAKIKQAQIKHYQQNHTKATPEEICELSGVKSSTYALLAGSLGTVASLESEGDEDGERMPLMEILPDKNSFHAEEVLEKVTSEKATAAVQAALARMPERMAFVARRRWMEEATLQQIAEEVNLSRERVRQITVQARTRLRKELARDYANLNQ
jgi:RNA polymerase nonessential primary-like sigma factor